MITDKLTRVQVTPKPPKLTLLWIAGIVYVLLIGLIIVGMYYEAKHEIVNTKNR